MADDYAILCAMIAGERLPPPVAQLVGFRLVSISPDASVVELDVEERYANGIAGMHGGFVAEIAAAAMGLAYATTLGREDDVTNLDLHIRFIRPVPCGQLRAVARVVCATRTTGVVESDVIDAEGRMVARASSTLISLRTPPRGTSRG